MTLMISWFLMAALGLAPAASPPNAASQAADARVDVSGSWSFQVEFAGGSGTPAMTFKQDGEKLTGHYSGQLGEAPLTEQSRETRSSLASTSTSRERRSILFIRERSIRTR